MPTTPTIGDPSRRLAIQRPVMLAAEYWVHALESPHVTPMDKRRSQRDLVLAVKAWQANALRLRDEEEEATRQLS